MINNMPTDIIISIILDKEWLKKYLILENIRIFSILRILRFYIDFHNIKCI